MDSSSNDILGSVCMEKIVFHIDVNSAFLSWSASYRVNVLGEKTDLRNVPSIVGGDEKSRHGIVLAKSIPAKKFKIHTGEAIMTAKKKCPGLIVIPPDYHLYVSASKALIKILKSYTDKVEQYSIDEAWAEFSGFEKIYGDPVIFGEHLKDTIKEKLGFTVNIGISTNRLLSKMAGELKKPDAVNTLFEKEIPEKMWTLPVGELFYVGRATQKKLLSLGILSIGELAQTDLEIIKSHLKKQGEIIWNYAWGKELVEYMYKPINPKGYGNSITLPVDATNVIYARKIILSLCETVGMRIRADGVKVSVVSVSIKTSLFEYSTKQTQLLSSTNITEEIYETACKVFDLLWDKNTPIRQIGVHTSKVVNEEYRQYNFLEKKNYDKLLKVNKAVDQIRNKYGEDSILRAGFLKGNISHLSGGLNKERRTGITVGIDLSKEREL